MLRKSELKSGRDSVAVSQFSQSCEREIFFVANLEQQQAWRKKHKSREALQWDKGWKSGRQSEKASFLEIFPSLITCVKASWYLFLRSRFVFAKLSVIVPTYTWKSPRIVSTVTRWNNSNRSAIAIYMLHFEITRLTRFLKCMYEVRSYIHVYV